MKATLEFDLPEDNSEYMAAIHGLDFYLVCWEMDQQLRSWLKYGHSFESVDDALEKVREELGSLMADRNINLDMIEE